MSFFILPDANDAGAYETLAPAAATPLTAATYNNFSRPSGSRKAKKALITVTGQPCRYRIDGGVPTSTVGNVLAVNDGVLLTRFEQIESFQIIETAASASVQVTYFF
jgi:hypothetical protein